MQMFIKRIWTGIPIGIGILIPIMLFLGGLLLAQVPHSFTANQVVSAGQLNANFNQLTTDIGTNALTISANSNKLVPVGGIVAWHKSLTGAPALADGWVECDGSVIVDSDSPFDGQASPNLNNPPNAWNARGVFLRGHSVSGLFENDAFQGHKHDDTGHTHTSTGVGIANTGSPSLTIGAFSFPPAVIGTGFANLTDPTTSSAGAPRFGNETVAVNMSVIWVMRIK